jgi:hypothetical protein
MLEEELRQRYVDGLLPRLGIELADNAIRHGGYTFKTAQLFGMPESNLIMKALYEVGCPLRRLDIAQIGSSMLGHYTREMESRVKRSGLVSDEWLDELKEDVDFISRVQLAWKSTLTWPVELFPESIGNKYVKERVKGLSVDELGRLSGALELSTFDLWLLIMGLFRPVSDFEPGSATDLISDLWNGIDPLNAMTSNTLDLVYGGRDPRKKSWAVETGGGLAHRILNVISLGAVKSPNGYTNPPLPGFFTLRNAAWLKHAILPAIEEQGEQIRLATTVVGVRQAKRGALSRIQDDEMAETYERAKEAMPKSIRKHPEHPRYGEQLEIALSKTIPQTELLEMLAREVAVHEIDTDTSTLPFYQSMVLSCIGQGRDASDALRDRVADILDTLAVRYTEPQEHFDIWENFTSLLPDIRLRETRNHVVPLPSLEAAVNFRLPGVPVILDGALVGYYLPYRDPLIIPREGNYFFLGTTGAGKSQALLHLIRRLLPQSNRWVFRIMDNTDVNIKSMEKTRGYKDLVREYDGLVLFAGDPKYDGDKGEGRFRADLEQIWENGTRVVLFHSTINRMKLDHIWLEWLSQDIQITPPGVYAVDETADWYRLDDKRADFWTNRLLNQFRRHNKLSVTTIQSLGLVREANKAVWEQLLTLIDAGIFCFWTPNVNSLPEDLNMSRDAFPDVCNFLTQTVAGFRPPGLGTLKKPGHAVLVTGGQYAQEVVFHINTKALQRYARKDLSTTEVEELWGL